MALVPPTAFGELLRHYRSAAGLTQEELAEQAGLSTRAISDLERGVNQTPRKYTVPLLVESLHLTEQDRVLFEGQRVGAPPPRSATVTTYPRHRPPSSDASAKWSASPASFAGRMCAC